MLQAVGVAAAAVSTNNLFYHLSVFLFIYLSSYSPSLFQQEPGGNGAEIMNGVVNVCPGGGFNPSFTMFTKVEVNGENEHPLFKYLKVS